MTEKQWYEDVPCDEFEGKHVRDVVDSGTVFEGRLELWDSRMVVVCMGSLGDGIYVLKSINDCWYLMGGIKSLDLVWDERDWERIDAKDLRDGDAVVANGQLYKVDVSWVHEDPPQVVTDTPGRMRIDLRLVSCALRRKVKVPSKYGYYRDRDGFFWARTMRGDKKPWHPINQYSMDTPAMSDEAMAFLMPLTPVHFVDGRAPEPGDELASVMRITSKGVTFTTEAA